MRAPAPLTARRPARLPAPHPAWRASAPATAGHAPYPLSTPPHDGHSSSPSACCRSTPPRSPFTVSTTPPSVTQRVLPRASPKGQGTPAFLPTRSPCRHPAPVRTRNTSDADPLQHRHRPGAAAHEDTASRLTHQPPIGIPDAVTTGSSETSAPSTPGPGQPVLIRACPPVAPPCPDGCLPPVRHQPGESAFPGWTATVTGPGPAAHRAGPPPVRPAPLAAPQEALPWR